MKLQVALLASPFVFASSARAQVQSEWVALRDGAPGLNDYGWSCAVDAAGNVFAVGDSRAPSASGGQYDGVVIKHSASGAFQWSRRFDLVGYDDALRDVAISPAGDVYATGSSMDGAFGAPGTKRMLVLVKYSSAGVQQWVKRYQPQGIADLTGKALAFDSNGNVVVAGSRNFGTQLVSYAPDGTLLWEHHFGGGGQGGSSLIELLVTAQDEILACGTRSGIGHQNFAVYKFSADGTHVWTAVPDLATNDQGVALDLALGTSGKVIAGGSRWANQDHDAVLAQVDIASGAVDWTRYHDGGYGTDEVNALVTDGAGTTWAALRSTNANGKFDWTTLRVSSSGLILTSAAWDGPQAQNDYPFSALLGSAGQVWIVGSTGASANDVAVVQYGPDGAFHGQLVFSVTSASTETAPASVLAPNDRIVIAGSSDGGPSGTYDVMVVTLDVGESPAGYCTAKVNSLGCTPRITFTGQSSASAVNGFAVRCDNVLNQKSGLLLYGTNGAASTPFQGGFHCVASPVSRTPAQSSNGSVSGADCSGAFALDMNAFASGTLGGSPSPALSVVGTDVFCQQWSRDPGAQANSGLSSGLRYTVLP